MSGAFITGVYPNVFENIGIDKATIDKRANDIFMTLFYGSDDERLYHPVEPDLVGSLLFLHLFGRHILVILA